MDNGASSPPHHILGYAIRSQTFVYVYYIIPSILGLFVYICQIIADCAVSYEHFNSKQPLYAWGTISLILATPILTFIFILSSKDQRHSSSYVNPVKFFGFQVVKLTFFPFFVIYRFSVEIFWSIEALFQKNDTQRIICLERAEKCSAFAIYNFIQAYAQSAPQIILQLYHMLTADYFRNFQTTHAQAISLVFSLINLAAITSIYQRFESQKQVGRHYLWSTSKVFKAKQKIFESNKRLRNECDQERRESQRKIINFQESDKIIENFQQRNSEIESNDCLSRTSSGSENTESLDQLDNTTKILLHNNSSTPIQNVTDDEKIKTKPLLKLQNIQTQVKIYDNLEIIDDQIPDSPAPLPPAHTHPKDLTPEIQSNMSRKLPNKQNFSAFCLLKILKDMLILNTQLYIKEKIPHPPKIFINRIDDNEKEKENFVMHSTKHATVFSPQDESTQDDVDFFLPRPMKIINGIYQDDITARIIAFFGWITFIIMRMLSLVSFCVFFPKSFFVIIAVHYLIMLFGLVVESRLRGKLNRILFYFILAYVYIFVLLEFRIKFKRIRLWYIGYFLLMMSENIIMTVIWFSIKKFESWWFSFIFDGIIYSCVLFIITLIVYYCILKPKDVTLIVDDNDTNSK